jgi:hypothetical protein
MSILSLIVVALIGEAVWETLKMTWDKGKISVDRIGALVIGLVLAFVTGLDMLKLLDITSTGSYIGMFLTGILISRGSNFMHDLLAAVNNVQVNSKEMKK